MHNLRVKVILKMRYMKSIHDPRIIETSFIVRPQAQPHPNKE